jgi:hypothetical protein
MSLLEQFASPKVGLGLAAVVVVLDVSRRLLG